MSRIIGSKAKAVCSELFSVCVFVCVCVSACALGVVGVPPPPAWLVLSCGVQGQIGQLLPLLLAGTAVGARGIEIEDLHFVVVLLT